VWGGLRAMSSSRQTAWLPWWMSPRHWCHRCVLDACVMRRGKAGGHGCRRLVPAVAGTPSMLSCKWHGCRLLLRCRWSS
jgi:hypothetical protein